MGLNAVQEFQKMSLDVGNENLGTHTIALALYSGIGTHFFYILRVSSNTLSGNLTQFI